MHSKSPLSKSYKPVPVLGKSPSKNISLNEMKFNDEKYLKFNNTKLDREKFLNCVKDNLQKSSLAIESLKGNHIDSLRDRISQIIGHLSNLNQSNVTDLKLNIGKLTDRCSLDKGSVFITIEQRNVFAQNICEELLVNNHVDKQILNVLFKILTNPMTVDTALDIAQQALSKPIEAQIKPNMSIKNIAPKKVDLFDSPYLREYYAMSTHTKTVPGVGGVRRHTEQVVDNFRYFKDDCQAKTSLSPEFFEDLLKLHDIGKGVSNDTSKQYENSEKVIQGNYKKIGLTKDNADLICTIVKHESIGNLFRTYNEKNLAVDKLDYKNAAQILHQGYLEVKCQLRAKFISQ